MANISPKGRVSFPNVFRPHAFNEGDVPKYDLTLLFNKEDMSEQQMDLLKKMAAEANKASIERFGCKVGETVKGRTIASPFRKSDEKPEYYQPGMVFVKFSTRQQPGVVYGDRTPIDPASRDFYAGCWAHVSYTVYTYDKSGNRGVAFGLNNVQKTGDDEPFSGGASAVEDDFEAIETEGASALADAINEDDLQF